MPLKTHTKVQLLIFWKVWVISLILFCLLVFWPKTGTSCNYVIIYGFLVKNLWSMEFFHFLIWTPKPTITTTAANSYLLMLEVWYFICVSSIRLSNMWLYISKLNLGWSIYLKYYKTHNICTPKLTMLFFKFHEIKEFHHKNK